jgi:glycosyltransferase involved in cell wall biosynthesis
MDGIEGKVSNKRILVLCPCPEGFAPGQRLKYEQYFEHFRQAGYQIVVSSFMTARFYRIAYKPGNLLPKVFWTLVGYARRIYDLFRLPFYDGAYIFLWVTPLGPPFFETLTCMLQRNIIFDIDDLVFLGHTSEANRWIRWLKGKQKPIYLIKRAKHCITCTPFLDNFVRQYNTHTTDISSTVDTQRRYLPVNTYEAKAETIVGWSGSLTTVKYLYLLTNVLQTVARQRNIKLLVMGSADFYIEGVPVEALGWREEIEIPTLQRFDIGLYPLPDEEWVYGKSGLKAIQYMALGIPTVATAIGTNFRVIESGVDGFLVSTEAQWIETLLLLIDNPELRKQIGTRARKTVESRFSVHANAPHYLAAFEKVYGKPTAVSG